MAANTAKACEDAMATKDDASDVTSGVNIPAIQKFWFSVVGQYKQRKKEEDKLAEIVEPAAAKTRRKVEMNSARQERSAGGEKH